MPNWCRTEIRYVSNDKKSLSDFVKKLHEWRDKKWTKRCGYRPETLALQSGVAHEKGNDKIVDAEGHEIYCRGEIFEISLDADGIHIIVMEAWSPHLRLWELLKRQYLPGADLLFTASEPSKGILFTNDPQYKNMCQVDTTADWFKKLARKAHMEKFDFDTWTIPEQDVIKILQTELHTDKTDIDELIKMHRNSEHADNLFVRRWDYDADIEALM